MIRLPKETIVVTFRNSTIVRIVLIIVGTLLGIEFLQRITKPLVLIFIAFFLALALNPAVDRIAKSLKSRSRARATGVAYLVVLSFLISFFSLVLPPLVRQTVWFVQDVPSTVSNFRYHDSPTARLVHRYRLDDELTSLAADVGNSLPHQGRPILRTAGKVGATLASFIAVLVLTFMMLVEGPLWLEKFWELQPVRKQARYKALATKMYNVVTGYVNGQVLVAAIGGAFALIAMLIASVALGASINAVALAGIVTLLGLVPLIGNILAALIVILACLFVSGTLALIMAVYFLIYLQVENSVLRPYIQAKSNQMTPLLVFMAALVGAGFGGLLGALVAIPALACLKILVQDHLRRRSTDVSD